MSRTVSTQWKKLARPTPLGGRRVDIIAHNEERQRAGAGFRFWLWMLIATLVVLLTAAKYDAEIRMRLDDKVRIVKTTQEEAAAQEEELRRAGVRFEESGNVIPSSVAEAMARATHDGDATTAVMLRDLGTQLTTALRYDPYEVLDVPRGASPQAVQTAFDQRISTPGLTDRQIAQIKQSRDMLTSMPARTFISLYGSAPPEHIRVLSPRDGGFGQRLQMRERYSVILHSMLAHYNHHAAAQLVALLFVFAPAVLLVAKRFPTILATAKRLRGDLTSSDDDGPPRPPLRSFGRP